MKYWEDRILSSVVCNVVLTGRFVVTASADKTARLWDAATGKSIGGPMKHDDDVVSARFSPNDRWVVTASWDTARVWDVATVLSRMALR